MEQNDNTSAVPVSEEVGHEIVGEFITCPMLLDKDFKTTHLIVNKEHLDSLTTSGAIKHTTSTAIIEDNTHFRAYPADAKFKLHLFTLFFGEAGQNIRFFSPLTLQQFLALINRIPAFGSSDFGSRRGFEYDDYDDETTSYEDDEEDDDDDDETEDEDNNNSDEFKTIMKDIENYRLEDSAVHEINDSEEDAIEKSVTRGGVEYRSNTSESTPGTQVSNPLYRRKLPASLRKNRG